MKIAINGFGRIGRMTLKALQNHPEVEIVAINDLTDVKTLAHLLKYDTAHGLFPSQISTDDNSIFINGKKIIITNEKNPIDLPWKELGIDVVVESTGRFTNKKMAHSHIEAGAKKVLITAPASGGVETIVHGVNNPPVYTDQIYSTASCTTGCIAPILYVLDKEFGVESGFMATVHAFTADQNLQDAPHSDLRRARAASYSIIPTTTGAAKAIGDVLPNLKGKLDGFSYRVPVIDVSIVDLSINLSKEISTEMINDLFKHYAGNSLNGIMEYTEVPFVSADILGNKHSSVVDGSMTKTIGKMVKVVAWYDNEVGISNRIAELVSLI
ncbi:type I glyceraldehyde-3-phosphate dehydrogenase [Chryseobacterium sp. S-02]|uniref:type I glyceraldehyde-3-phosphate dehydrogenase n=1 Tax=unclassified Chryseobacterium TaxID=2593645 RepID=UPI002359B81C|nr:MULTISPECIES: type I glyceraldehyde-3-phosphate dehydrogenase [unclassified Chryseobacterium]MDC8104992.1 type I glyceraldehyde-3-phosphate dehydrogenase [Chryseobacterium sp. B21-037]MDR6919947.1 glyceraldehyde 3-phosphate dehydrogenase [Chryseobacterium sp. 2987]